MLKYADKLLTTYFAGFDMLIDFYPHDVSIYGYNIVRILLVNFADLYCCIFIIILFKYMDEKIYL